MSEQTPGKPEIPDYFYRKNTRGLTEAVETATGRIIAVQASHLDLLEKKWDRLIRFDTPQGVVWIEKGLNADLIPGLSGVEFSRVVGDLICQDVAEGEKLTKVGAKYGVNYSDICRWRRENDKFDKAVEAARRDRAEGHFDEALEVAEQSKKPYLQVETLKWAAEKGDPKGFGVEKGAQGGGPTGPVTFQLVTNIIRPGDPGHEIIAAARPVTDIGQYAEKAVAEIEVPDFGGNEDG